MPENTNANRTFATLRIWSKKLEPDKVTQALHLTPSKAFKRGDRRTEAKEWPHGYWEITSENQIISTDLALHIEWLLDQLEPVRPQLAAIMAEESVKADIFCFWESRTGHGGPSFSPQLLGRIAALGLELGIDIYFAS
jgi:hypothetical protein